MTTKQIREMLRFVDKLGMNVEDAIEAIKYMEDIYKKDDMDIYKEWIEEGQFREQDDEWV